MRFLSALAIQLLALVLRHHSKGQLSCPLAEPIEVVCHCAPEPVKRDCYQVAGVALTSGLLAGGLLWHFVLPFLASKSCADGRGGSRLRGRRVLEGSEAW